MVGFALWVYETFMVHFLCLRYGAGSDWLSSRALLTPKPSRMRWALKSTRTIKQTARNCAGQFSILPPREKRQSKKGVIEILSFSLELGLRLSD